MDRRFTRDERLRKRSEFLRLGACGTKITTRTFIILWKSSDEGPTRIGVTVSRKVGCAPVRNRFKRLVREYYRLHKPFPPGDYNFIVKKGAGRPEYGDICRELDPVFRKISGMPC